MRHPGSPDLILSSRGPARSAAIAAALGHAARAGDCLALYGDLGAGKTLFVRAFAEALGVAPGEVDSPSFVLLNEYAGRLPVFHFDAYRLAGAAEELAQAGFFDERLAGGVVLIEWAERLEAFLPEQALRIRIEIRGERARRIILEEAGERAREALR